MARFARSLATVVEDLRDCHPTVFDRDVRLDDPAVLGFEQLQRRTVARRSCPRVWEKLREALLARVAEEHAVKKMIVDSYLNLGQRVWAEHQTLADAPAWERLPYQALDGAVGAKIRHDLGLEQAHLLVTAAAPIHPDVIRWFHAIGLTGRKKDLIITAAGQNITPQNIEQDLRNHELISEAVLIGEGRRYLTALLTLDVDAVAGWAAAHDLSTTYETLVGDPDLHAEVNRMVHAANATRSRVEHIRKFRILPHELTMAAGEITPTLKVKRHVVATNYRDLIDDMYADR